MRITTQKISEKEVLKLYSDLITTDITELENAKGKGKNKRHKILDVLRNLKSVFTGVYFHYKDLPKETIFERSILEKTKLRERLDEIKEKEQNINNLLFKEYFTDYKSPSNMSEKLIETEDAEVNKIKADFIKKILSKLQKTVDCVTKYDTLKTKENKKIIDIVKHILEFNDKIQLGQGLKILTPNQMLSRLPMSLAQLKARNNSEKLKNKLRQILYSLYR